MKAFAAILSLALLLLPLPARAEASLSSYDAVRQALIAIWAELPLTARNATLTTGPATAYGAYTARESNTYAPGEVIEVYVEVLGYGWEERADGSFGIGLDADLFLMDEEGVTLARQDKFLSTDLVSREKRLETFLSFEANLSGFPAGSYELRYRLTDRASGKQTEFALPISLSAAPDQQD